MRFGTPQLRQVLLGSFNLTYSCDVFVEGERVMQSVPITNINLDDNSTALVQGTGSFTIVYQDPFGKSIAPLSIADVFAPFGTQVDLYAIITAGAGFSEKVLLGTYLVSETPTINATWTVFNGAVLSKGDQIDISIQDLMYRTQKNTFDTPSSPSSLISVWSEFQRLMQIAVTRTISDAAIPNTVAYQTDRLQAVYDLAAVLDATACMTPDGTASMRPNVWPAVMDEINGGDGGTLLTAPRAMQSDNVFNKLRVKDQVGNILGSGWISDGPLRAANADGSLSPYGTVPTDFTSPQITTAGQAEIYIAANLPRIAGLRGMQVQITEVFNPLRDLGDVVTVNRKVRDVVTESFDGRVTAISRTSAKSQQVTLAVGQ